MTDEWMSASAVRDWIGENFYTHDGPEKLAKRAHGGLVKTKAAMLVKRGHQNQAHETLHDEPLPPEFWWAEGHIAMDQDWHTGDFSTWMSEAATQRKWDAFDVQFARGDVVTQFPMSQSPPATSRRGGRRRNDDAWGDWIAALAVYLHGNGIPSGVGSQGQGEIIDGVATILSEQGKDELSRATVQPVVQKVLNALRSAEN